MGLRDMMNNLDLKRAIAPVSGATNDSAQVSEILDTAGYSAVALAILTGAIADVDATFTVLFEHGDAANLSDAAAVADEYLNGTEVLAAFQFDDDNECRKIGYTGGKRYVRCTITPANNTGAWLIGAVWVCKPYRTPAVNPPV